MTEPQQRTILITGCSSGIGQCVARGLRKRGYRVFASARQPEDVERLRSEGFTDALQLDLDHPDSIARAVDQVLAATDGRVYGLFNNGAYGQPGAVEDLSRDVLRAQFETNLFGWHDLTCRLIPTMRRQGEGRIIQNSSVLGFAAFAFRGAYNASKFALEGLTDTLRLELAGCGIHVCLIEPGPIESRFRANAVKKWQENIDIEHSVHKERYQAVATRLNKVGPAAPFTLPPEAVLKKVIHALESPRPRLRYRVTAPTHALAVLKRVLSGRALDRVLGKLSNEDGR